MLNDKKKRLNYIDWAKAVSITLIVMGHMLPSGSWFKTLAYAFHVPIFALIGGLLFTAPNRWSDVLKKLFGIFKRMVVPYVIWFVISSSLYFMSKDAMPNIVSGTATTNFTELLKYFVFFENVTVWNDPLWFMPCYILLSILFLLFAKLTLGSRIASGALSITSFTTAVILEKFEITLNIGEVKNAFGFNNYLLLLGFIAAGYALRPILDRCSEVVSEPKKNPILCGGALVFFVFAILCLMHNKVDTSAGYFTLSFYSSLYNGVLSYILFAAILSTSLLLAFMLLPKVKIVNLISRNSLFIMLTHYFFFLEITFFWLKGAEWREFMKQNGMVYWELDFSIGIRDGIFIMLMYVLLFLIIDTILKKFPKLKAPLGFIGLQ